jgi:hypothetical protein
MKQQYKYRIFLLFIAVISPCVLFLFLGSAKPENEETQRPEPFASTISIPIPSSVAFCDRNISLDRLDMRERFDREINSFTYFHSSTLMYIKKANRYFPIIEPILKKYDVPDDFKYLCVIESGLDTRAVSPVKATGLWQFMEGTAKNYGLEIREGVDERYHIEKSTDAACRYFRDAYKRYGDWVNVAASYNAGTARISGELEKQQVESAFDLLLVPETSRYVFRMMAIKAIFTHPDEYGFILKKNDLYPSIPVEWVEVQTDISDLAAFARQYDLNYMLLKEFNPWLRDTKLIFPKNASKSYRIAIPKKEDLYYRKNAVKVHDKAWIVD